MCLLQSSKFDNFNKKILQGKVTHNRIHYLNSTLIKVLK